MAENGATPRRGQCVESDAHRRLSLPIAAHLGHAWLDGWRTIVAPDSETAIAMLGHARGGCSCRDPARPNGPGDKPANWIAELKSPRPAPADPDADNQRFPPPGGQAMRAGATSTVYKPVSPDRLMEACAASPPAKPRATNSLRYREDVGQPSISNADESALPPAVPRRAGPGGQGRH